LADEADGPTLEPTAVDETIQLGFNTDYLPTPPGVAASVKWRVLGVTGATPVHPHASSGNVVDNYPTTPSEAEFWEGGDGFQTKVYRTAKDCLMRRRLSDMSALLRARRIPFCLACRTALIWELAAR
jgi:hypothetical protein